MSSSPLYAVAKRLKTTAPAAAAGRTFNFSPGPAMLSTRVIERAAAEFTNFRGTGMCAMEITNLDADGLSHPGEARHELQAMMLETESNLRALLDIPASYRVLFMHGGAVGQFSAVPLNLAAAAGSKVDVVDVGFWSQRARAEAAKYADVAVAATFTTRAVPWQEWTVRKDAAYVHVCLNETVQGLELFDDFAGWPATHPPLVADATSTLLSRPINVAQYGLIYASGGKNVPPGVAVVIVRDALLRERAPHALTPQIMDYRLQAGALTPTASIFESRPNTPPTWAVYMLSLVLADIETTHGSLARVAQWQRARMQALYDVIDASDGFYACAIDKPVRSLMNAVFRLPSEALSQAFVRDAEQRGLRFLFGHASNPGSCRVTAYIGLPDEALDAVKTFMQEFRAKHAT